jgi:hypothetical protein
MNTYGVVEESISVQIRMRVWVLDGIQSYTLVRCNFMVIITMDMSERGWKFDDMLKAQGISVIHVPKEFVQSDLPLNKSSIEKVPFGPEGKRRFLEVTSRIFANPQKQAKKLTV